MLITQVSFRRLRLRLLAQGRGAEICGHPDQVTGRNVTSLRWSLIVRKRAESAANGTRKGRLEHRVPLRSSTRICDDALDVNSRQHRRRRSEVRHLRVIFLSVFRGARTHAHTKCTREEKRIEVDPPGTPHRSGAVLGTWDQVASQLQHVISYTAHIYSPT